MPCIPGGAGVAIKATRAVGALANIAGGVLSVQDGLENGNYIEAGLGALQATAGIGQGVGLAKRISNEKKTLDFYTNSGMSKGDAKSHMQGIDFSKKVNVTNLSEGTIVEQYQARGRSQGNYYTPQGGNPNNLGIDITGRIKNSYTVNQPTRVLESTAANTTKNTKLPPSCRGQGGGVQYFSTDCKNFTPME